MKRAPFWLIRPSSADDMTNTPRPARSRPSKMERENDCNESETSVRSTSGLIGWTRAAIIVTKLHTWFIMTRRLFILIYSNKRCITGKDSWQIKKKKQKIETSNQRHDKRKHTHTHTQKKWLRFLLFFCFGNGSIFKYKWAQRREGRGWVRGGTRGGVGGRRLLQSRLGFCVSHEERRHGGGQRFSGTFSAVAAAFDSCARRWIVSQSPSPRRQLMRLKFTPIKHLENDARLSPSLSFSLLLYFSLFSVLISSLTAIQSRWHHPGHHHFFVFFMRFCFDFLIKWQSSARFSAPKFHIISHDDPCDIIKLPVIIRRSRTGGASTESSSANRLHSNYDESNGIEGRK